MEPFAGFPYKSIYGLPIEFNCSESIRKSFAECETNARYEWSVTYDNYFYATKEFCCFAWKQLACELPLITQCNQPKYHELMESETVNMFNNICNDKDFGRESTTCRWKEIATTVGIVASVIVAVGILCTCGFFYLLKSKSPTGDKSNIFTRSFEFLSKKLRPSQSQPPAEAASEAATSLSSSMASLSGESSSKLPLKYTPSLFNRTIAEMEKTGVNYKEARKIMEQFRESPPPAPARRFKFKLFKGKGSKAEAAITEVEPSYDLTKSIEMSEIKQAPPSPQTLPKQLYESKGLPAVESKAEPFSQPIPGSSSIKGSQASLVGAKEPPKGSAEMITDVESAKTEPTKPQKRFKFKLFKGKGTKAEGAAEVEPSPQPAPEKSSFKGSKASLVEAEEQPKGSTEIITDVEPAKTEPTKPQKRFKFKLFKGKGAKAEGVAEVEPPLEPTSEPSSTKGSKASLADTTEVSAQPGSQTSSMMSSKSIKRVASTRASKISKIQPEQHIPDTEAGPSRVFSRRGSRPLFVESEVPHKDSMETGFKKVPPPIPQKRFKMKDSKLERSTLEGTTEMEPSSDLTQSIPLQEMKQAPTTSQAPPTQQFEPKDLMGIESKPVPSTQPTLRPSSIKGSKSSLVETAKMATQSSQPSSQQTSSMMSTESGSVEKPIAIEIAKISKIQQPPPPPTPQQTIILGPAEPSTSSSISSSSSSMSEALSVEQANLRAAQVTATKLIEKILPEVVKMMDKTQMPPPTPPQP